MPMTIELGNANMVKITTHHKYNIVVAVGYRTVFLFDHEINQTSRILDADTNEKYHCVEFVELNPDWNILNGKNTQEGSTSNSIPYSSSPDECMSIHSLIVKTVHPNPMIYIAVAGEAGLIKLFDVSTGKLIQVLRGHTGPITYIKVLHNLLFSASKDSSIRVFDCITGKCLSVIGGLLGHRDAIFSFDIHGSYNKLAASGSDCIIMEWDISHLSAFIAQPLHVYENVHNSSITCIKYYGELIVSLSNKVIEVIASRDIYGNYNTTTETEEYTLKEGVYVSNRRNMLSNSDRATFFENVGTTPLLVGRIDLYNISKSFLIHNDMLLAMSNTGEAYLYDMKLLGSENTPVIVEGDRKNCIDFCYSAKNIYITYGSSVKKMAMDI